MVTWTLIGVNVAIFLGMWTLPEAELRRTFLRAGIVPRRFTDPAWAASVGFSGSAPWAFFSSMFLHGGFFHLVSNMWSLWIFGDNVEDRMGHARFLGFYLATGLAAGLVHALSSPASQIPTIGASGAIAGVLGAYLVLFPRSSVLTLIPICFFPWFVELPAVVFLGFWFVSQVVNGAAGALGGDVGGVAWWAHIGGFVAGLVVFRWFLDRRWTPMIVRREAGGPVILVDPPSSTDPRRRH